MLVTVNEYQRAWNKVRKQSLSHSTYSVLLFVSCLDVDAFVSSIMLGSLLQKHLILYKTEPVIGYSSLRESFSRLESSIKNVFLIGCGSSIDLEEYLGLDESNADLNIHVFDCKRPWNLNNLFGSQLVICYEDCDIKQFDRYREAYDFLANDANTDNDSNNSDDTRFQGSQSQKSQEIESTQSDRDPATSRRKRHKSERQTYTEVLEAYYDQGSHLLSTNAIQVYTFLAMIGETSLRMLWLAVVGLTSIEGQYPHLYNLLIPTLQDEMRRLNHANNSDASSTIQDQKIKLKFNFNTEPDYSLFLLRQWCLYESMVHSSYINAKLFLWREDGRKKLHKLLARIGITLQDAKESWTHMKPTLKRALKSKLDSVSEIYGIEGITRQGVIRHFGLAGVMSAGDCVESVAAVLETGKAEPLLRDYDGQESERGTSDEEYEREYKELTETWVKNFWIAWDAWDDFESMKRGVEKAKALQSAVVTTANYIFDKNLPKDLQTFRMVVVQDAPDIQVFWNPLSLQRLVNWVFEGCAELNSTNLPMVFAVLNEHKHTYLVYGIGGRKPRDSQQTESLSDFNKFGSQFQETAARINARIRIDAFDSAIIELSREDLPRFLEALDTERS